MLNNIQDTLETSLQYSGYIHIVTKVSYLKKMLYFWTLFLLNNPENNYHGFSATAWQ